MLQTEINQSSEGEKSEGGLGGSLYKRRGRMRGGKGREFARRLIDFRGFDLSEAQANDIARFIDLLPEEMEERVRETREVRGEAQGQSAGQ